MASPFAGTTVHWTFVFVRLTPVPARGRGFHRCAFLLRSKARGAPSVARPLGGTAIHWIAVWVRLALPSPRWAFSRVQAGLHESPYTDTSEHIGG